MKSNRLFVKRDGGVWTVSRFRMSCENGLFCVEAYDLLPVQIVEKLSEVMDKVVTFESLPAQRISVCFREVGESVLMDCLAKRFGVYDVEQDEAGYHFVKKNSVQRAESFSGMVNVEVLDGDVFYVDVEDCRFSVVLDKLFDISSSSYGKKSSHKSFCLLTDADCKIQRSVFSGSDFAGTLRVLCAQCGYDFVIENDIYYIFSSSSVREELVYGKRSWRKFTLHFTKSQDFLTFVFKRVGKLETITLADEYSFLCLASDSEAASIESLINEADIKQSAYIVNLKYLKPVEFLEHLPPAVDKSSLFLADDSSHLYFKGTEEAYNNLCTQLDVFDRPAVRLSYDLLILQYDETLQNNWASSFGAKRLSLGDRNGGSAVLGEQCFTGVNSVVFDGVTMGKRCIAGACSAVKRDMPDNTICKVSSDSFIYRTYDERIIESKLLVTSEHKKMLNKYPAH